MSNTGYHGITRIDSDAKRMNGYYVRLQRQRQRKSKWFADGQHDGSKRKALAAARKWRNKARRELEPDEAKRRTWVEGWRNGPKGPGGGDG